MIPAGWGCWIFWPHWGECQVQPHGWSAASAAFSSSRRAPLCVGSKTASGLSRMISGGDLAAGLTAAVWLCLSQVSAASSPTACSRWGPVGPGQGRWAPGKGAWSCGTARPAQPGRDRGSRAGLVTCSQAGRKREHSQGLFVLKREPHRGRSSF